MENIKHIQKIQTFKKMEKIFIGSIKNNTKPKDLQNMLLNSGGVLKVKKLYPKKGRVKKGFAIYEVLFKRYFTLKTFLKKRFFLEGEELFLTEYLNDNQVHKRNNELKYRKLHISGLEDNITDDQFFQMFERFGEIETAYVSRDRFEKKKQQMIEQNIEPHIKLFGFVTFKDSSSAEKCYQHRRNFFNRNIEITRFTPRNQDSNSDFSNSKSNENIGDSDKLAKPQNKGKEFVKKDRHNYCFSGSSVEDLKYVKKGTTDTNLKPREKKAVEIDNHQRGINKNFEVGFKHNIERKEICADVFRKILREPFNFDKIPPLLACERMNFTCVRFQHWGHNLRFNYGKRIFRF